MDKIECLEKDLYEIFRCISGLFIFENQDGTLQPNVSKQKCYRSIKEIQKIFSERKELVDVANKYLTLEELIYKENSNSYWASVRDWNERIRNEVQKDIVKVIKETKTFIYNEKYELPFIFQSVTCRENKCVIDFLTRTNDQDVLYDILTANTGKRKCNINGIDKETYCIARLMTPEKQNNEILNIFPYYSIDFQIVIYT